MAIPGITRFSPGMLTPQGVSPVMSRTQPVVAAPSYMPNAFPFSPSFGVNPATMPVQPQATSTPVPAASPMGLLSGGQTDYRSLLGDVNRASAQEGLYASLMGLARPVRRGESRLLGAMQLGQQAQQQARQAGLTDLSSRMKIDEMERARLREQQRLELLAGAQQRLQGVPGQAPAMADEQAPTLSTFSAYQQSQMDPNQLALAQRAEIASQEANRLAFVAPDEAKALRDQAAELREQATVGILDRTEAGPREESLRKEFVDNYVKDTNEIVRRRSSLIELLKQGGPVSKYLTFVSAIKTVEPTSAVLSSEYESAQALSGLLTRVQQALENIDGSQPLPEAFRKDMEAVGQLMAEAAMEHYNKGAEQYQGIATRSNLNPDNVIIEPTAIRESTSVGGSTIKNPASSARSIRGGTRGGVAQ